MVYSIAYSSKCIYDRELLSMEIEHLFDDSEDEGSFDNNVTSNKASNEAKQEYCKHYQQLVSSQRTTDTKSCMEAIQETQVPILTRYLI